MLEHAKAAGSAEEFLVCTELLPAIRERYGATFTLLEIPEVLRSDRSAGLYGTVYFRDYSGEKYNDKWNEGNGGAPLGTALSSDMVRLLEDLKKIDVGWLLSLHPIGKTVDQGAFDIPNWLFSLTKRSALASSLGISEDELKRAGAFVDGGFSDTRRIISNGDFYPRNLIKLPNRMVLVDWGYWEGYRACFLDYLVNVAAFAFIHMWGNGLWQMEFIRRLQEALAIGLDDLRRAVLIKSFEQAIFWHRIPQLAQPQVRRFRAALRNELLWADGPSNPRSTPR